MTAGTSKKQRKKARSSHRQAAAAAIAQNAASADTSTAGPSPSQAHKTLNSAMAESSAGSTRNRTVPQPQVERGQAHQWMLCPLTKVSHQPFCNFHRRSYMTFDVAMLSCISMVSSCVPCRDSECKRKILCIAPGAVDMLLPGNPSTTIQLRVVA